MKTAVSLGLVNTMSSLSDNMNLNYKWYWENLIDWIAATGFESIAMPMIPNAFNVGRGGAPRCTLAVNTKYGSAQGYLNFLNDRGISNVCEISISAQAMLNDMFESGKSFEDLYPELYKHADDVSDMVAALGGKVLTVSPTPMIGELKARLGDSQDAFKAFVEKAAACINEIGEMTAKKGVRTCVKNEFWTLLHGDMVDKFFGLVDAAKVGYCADAAMLYIAKADPIAKVKQYAGNLGSVYFTDSDFVDTIDNYTTLTPEYPQAGPQQRCYKDLGFGKVDLAGMYSELKNNGYDGYIILEPRYTTNVPRALLRTRTYWTKLTKEA